MILHENHYMLYEGSAKTALYDLAETPTDPWVSTDSTCTLAAPLWLGRASPATCQGTSLGGTAVRYGAKCLWAWLLDSQVHRPSPSSLRDPGATPVSGEATGRSRLGSDPVRPTHIHLKMSWFIKFDFTTYALASNFHILCSPSVKIM